ncbi:MAG: hypothetical protein SNJ33_04110 [Rikenellaceae bacterium]
MNTILKMLLGALLLATVIILGYTVSTGGTYSAVSLCLIWAYALAGLTVASVLFCTVYGLILSPGGLIKSLLSVVGVAVVIGAAYFYASSHEILIPDVQNGGVYSAVDTVITEASIVVAYILGAGAVLSAIFSEVIGALK